MPLAAGQAMTHADVSTRCTPDRHIWWREEAELNTPVGDHRPCLCGAYRYATAQRILRDLDHRSFGQSPHFSMAVPGKDLPPRWARRLEVEPVP